MAEQGQAQRAAMSAIEKDCAAATKLRCDVVTLYSGAMYHLYRYKKYTDVRLVFAPEFAAAFFGGDPDNFEYPRYDLDVSFFRIYENNKPVQLNNYFQVVHLRRERRRLDFRVGQSGFHGAAEHHVAAGVSARRTVSLGPGITRAARRPVEKVSAPRRPKMPASPRTTCSALKTRSRPSRDTNPVCSTRL